MSKIKCNWIYERLNFSPIGKDKYPFKGKQPNERKIFVSYFIFTYFFWVRVMEYNKSDTNNESNWKFGVFTLLKVVGS